MTYNDGKIKGAMYK